MMMNRERIGFWVRLVSILLAVFFVGSFIFMGLGTNVNYNLFDLIGGSDQQQGQQGIDQTQQQIEQAEKELEENPKDPEAIKTLAALYFQEGRLDDAVRVLEEGRDAAPKDAEIPMFLGQVYSQEAQATPGDEKKALYNKAGGAYAAAAELEPKNEEAYLLAGAAYDQAGEPALAIKYWNGYLELKPEGEQAKAVKERISALLKGESATGSAQP
jgi:cytochrome c-type biogenesis protein CcmH/NrfG